MRAKPLMSVKKGMRCARAYFARATPKVEPPDLKTCMKPRAENLRSDMASANVFPTRPADQVAQQGVR